MWRIVRGFGERRRNLRANEWQVDKRGEKMYVRSSRVGKGLYEKFGWQVMNPEEGEKSFTIELKVRLPPRSIDSLVSVLGSEAMFSSSWNLARPTGN
jgi:hypothetical protein